MTEQNININIIKLTEDIINITNPVIDKFESLTKNGPHKKQSRSKIVKSLINWRGKKKLKKLLRFIKNESQINKKGHK